MKQYKTLLSLLVAAALGAAACRAEPTTSVSEVETSPATTIAETTEVSVAPTESVDPTDTVDPPEALSLSRIYKFPPLDPQTYRYYDYTEHARELDSLLFDPTAEGDYLPLIWEDETYDTFGLAAYVGDHRQGTSGGQEAVTTIASVLSASLIGIDKSDQNGQNYVEQLLPYFLENEQTVLNNLNGTSAGTSMWYQIYPSILYVQTSLLYPEETELRERALTTIESWYKALEIMAPADGEADFNYTGFDFLAMEPYQNQIWQEPDSATGIAVLMDLGYSLTGEERYKDALIRALDYIESFFGGPQYEILQYYGPYLNAKFNALEQKDYDMVKSFGRVFDGASIPRGGWGVISKQWGDYDMSGTFGATTDRGGYAFSMNTFAGLNAVIPAVKYAPEYANVIGDLVLRVTRNSLNFFSEHTDEKRQSTSYLDQGVAEEIKTLLPYEGVINSYQGNTPWFGGDPTIHDWAETDFSLYSGAHIGVMAHRLSPTNVEGVVKVQLNELSATPMSPFSLLYNPFPEEVTVNYTHTSEDAVDLYDVLTHSYLAKAESGETTITIPATSSVVLVELEAGAVLEEQDGNLSVNGEFIARK